MAKVIRRAPKPGETIFGGGAGAAVPFKVSARTRAVATGQQEPASAEPPLDLNNLPVDPVEAVRQAHEQALMMREAGASAIRGPDRSQ